MSRRTKAQIQEDEAKVKRDAEALILRTAAGVIRQYGIPASANVLEVVADSIENGTRKKVGNADSTVPEGV